MDSNYIKAHVLNYFRFKRKFMYIASECGAFVADILVSDETNLVEVEVKISYSDFIADFKKRKHNTYKKSRSIWVPNKFYFAVPEEIAEKCKKYLEEKKLKYGLLAILDDRYAGKELPLLYIAPTSRFDAENVPSQTYCAVHTLINASVLHNRKVNQRVLRTIMQRQSSELCKKYGELHCSLDD